MNIRILPDQPPLISWTGSAEEKLKLSKMDIRDRLRYLDHHNDILYQVDPWSGIKDKSKADLLKETGMRLVKNGKYVEAIQSFNNAIKTAPVEVRLLDSRFVPLNTSVISLLLQDKDVQGWICAGRSSAIFSLGYYDDCYQDCINALDQLPRNLTVQRVKLWERIGVCKSDLQSECLQNIR